MERQSGAPIREQIAKAKDFISVHYKEEDLNREDAAKFSGLNADYFGILFKKETGANFTEFLINFRLLKAEELLKTTKLDISQIAYEVGFGTLVNFNRAFKKKFRASPKELRKKAKE